MEYVKEICINEAVMHVLDASSNEAVLNDFRMQLDDETYTYIYKLCYKTLKDEKLKYAKFNENSNIKQLANDYFTCKKEIVGISKEIANDIFQILKNNGLNGFDVIVTSISTEYGSMIAILKIDYLKNYNHRIDIKDNEIDIDLTSTNHLSATIKQAAFIKSMKINGNYDLIVLDKSDNKEYSGKWFEEQFLKCHEIVNQRDITKKFINTAERFINVNLRDNAVIAEGVRKHIKKELKEKDYINIKQISEELFNDDCEIKKTFIETMEKQNIDNVEIDKVYVDKKLTVRKLKLAKDIELKISEEAYNDLSKFQIEKNLDGSINMTIRNIKNYSER